jgi:hypothetical protein
MAGAIDEVIGQAAALRHDPLGMTANLPSGGCGRRLPEKIKRSETVGARLGKRFGLSPH